MSIDSFAMSYQKSPILFVGGIAGNLYPWPIVLLTQGIFYTGGALSPSEDLQLSDFYYDFFPLSGSTFVNNQIGQYPFANQAVAANAIIAEPLTISLLMHAPARGPSAYLQKQSVFTALKQSIDQHTALGGTYNVATPSYIFQNLILTSLTDVSDGDEKRPQSKFRWDFVQPLLTLQAAQAAQGALMAKTTAQTQITPNAQGVISWSGPSTGIGNAASGQGVAAIPASTPLAAASISSPTTSSNFSNNFVFNPSGVTAGL